MAISLYQIKGSDPFSASRLQINNNFTFIENEINLLEDYFDLSQGTITNLTRLSTTELVVGTDKLTIDSTVLELKNTNISLLGDVTISGNLILESMNATSINNTNYPALTHVIGTTVDVPDYYIYKVSNTDSSALEISLHAGEHGQSILFVYENDASGTETSVTIENASTSTGLMYLGETGGVPYTSIQLDYIGDTVELKYIEDGWYIMNGYGYVLA